MNMEFTRKLPIPQDIKAQYPVTEKMQQIKDERAKAIDSMLSIAEVIDLMKTR